MQRKHLTPEQLQAAAEAEGSLSAVAALFGVTPGYISQLRIRAGAQRPPQRSGRPSKLSPEQEAELAASGRPTEDLAEAYGLDPTTVRRIRKQYNGPPPPPRRPAPVRTTMHPDRLKRLLAAKGTREEVAARFGITVHALRVLREQHRDKPKRCMPRLTPEIRHQIAISTGSSTVVAAQFGVCFGTVCRLRREHGAL